MEAVKGNKVYTVDEVSAESYRNQGFDIYDEEGNLLQYGVGKTVSYEEYAKVKTELEELKDQEPDAAQEDVVDLLKMFANEHGMDIGKSSTVSGIVKKIKEQLPEGGE